MDVSNGHVIIISLGLFLVVHPGSPECWGKFKLQVPWGITLLRQCAQLEKQSLLLLLTVFSVQDLTLPLQTQGLLLSSSHYLLFLPESPLCQHNECFLLYKEHLRSGYNWYTFYKLLFDTIPDSSWWACRFCSSKRETRRLNSRYRWEDRPQRTARRPTLKMEHFGILRVLSCIHYNCSSNVQSGVWCI